MIILKLTKKNTHPLIYQEKLSNIPEKKYLNYSHIYTNGSKENQIPVRQEKERPL